MASTWKCRCSIKSIYAIYTAHPSKHTHKHSHTAKQPSSVGVHYHEYIPIYSFHIYFFLIHIYTNIGIFIHKKSFAPALNGWML